MWVILESGAMVSGPYCPGTCADTACERNDHLSLDAFDVDAHEATVYGLVCRECGKGVTS